jgi:hypothetical protein
MIKAFNKQVPYSEVNNLSGLLLAGDEEVQKPVEPEVKPEVESTL